MNKRPRDHLRHREPTVERGARGADRRAWLIGFLGLLALPSTPGAQPQAKVFRIGFLGGSSRTSPQASHIWDGFLQGMRERGYVEGQNFTVEERWYEDRIERLPGLADELVKLRVDVIVVGTSPAPEAAKRATSTIPIVMINHGDPIGSGLVASFAKPGGNITGMMLNSVELRGKQLQLLKEAIPKLTSVAILSNPTINFSELEIRELEAAARSLKIRLHSLEARAPGEFEEAFSAARSRAGALLLVGNSLYFARRKELVDLAASSRLPAMYGTREFADAGGLMSYGVNFRETARQAARFVDRILKGARPADLPIEQPKQYELVINLRTAKALGLRIPASILARADHLIE